MDDILPRFALFDGTVDSFIDEQENKNTRQKTERDVNLLKTFLHAVKDDERDVEAIPPEELNEILSEFFISVRTKEGKEYEPTSLRSMLSSFERFLKRKSYAASIINDLVFEKTRKTLISKQKLLKKKGKGNKPQASVALTEEETRILYEKGLLGMSSPEAVLNTMWLNNSLHFGLRGIQEHRSICWGDVKLNKTAGGVEFLEYNERQTKTRTGANCRDVRPFPPKMFSTDGSEKDPVAVYKFFAKMRPEKMKGEDCPFYLAVNNTKKTESLQTKPWFKSNAVGINKLGSLMKDMAEKAGLNNPKLRNHSSRKTMLQTLTDNDVPPAHIAQLSGHKNLKSIENYSHISTKQQMQMSNILANMTSTSTSTTCTSSAVVEPPTNTESPPQLSSTNGQQALALFTGAVIHGGQISVTINTVNQSPPSTERQRKRIRISDDE